MKYFKALLAMLGYATLLLGLYYAHIRVLKVDVLLYSAIADAFIATLVLAAMLFGVKFFRLFNTFEKVLLTVSCFMAGYMFAITVPTVIDRSLSFYILEKMQQRGGGIRLDRFPEVFTREYVKEHRLVDVRLTEQQASGTISITNGCVTLTERGQKLASFGRFFRQHLLPTQRLLMGRYSDDLTDPFRSSIDSPGYECK
jgi:hypothetical protein